MTFCLKSVEIQAKLGSSMVTTFIVRCGATPECFSGAQRLFLDTPCPPGNGETVPGTVKNVTGQEPYLLDHFHWKLVSPKDLQTLEGHQNFLGNGSTYVLSSSPCHRDVQGKTNRVNQKTHKMSHVLYHTTQFYHGRRSKNSRTRACLTAW